MKISFIRGPFLNPWELQTYLPLVSRHDFTAVGADWQIYKHPIPGLAKPIQTPHLWASGASQLHPALPIALNRLRSWTLGESFGLSGLEKAVGDSDLLHPAETYSTMTWQCLNIRQQRGCKVVATVWENIPNLGETHPRRRARKRRALRELDGFLAVTETSRQMLLQEGALPDRIEVIPMAVDLAHFKPAARDTVWSESLKLSSQEKVVLFVGRFVEEKGIHDLLKAIPTILAKISTPVRFCFTGSGPLEKDIQSAARRHPGRIQIIPFVAYDRLPSLHNMADVFVLPSKAAPKWQEQFGYVLAESMACEKAVVTTKSGSIPDVVGDAAHLVSPGDPEALADSIIDLLSSHSRRLDLGLRARSHATDHFDARKNADRIEAFYQRILKTPR